MTVGFLIIGVILMFIIPIPSTILDILLALNISVSLVILLNTIYAKEKSERILSISGPCCWAPGWRFPRRRRKAWPAWRGHVAVLLMCIE